MTEAQSSETQPSETQPSEMELLEMLQNLPLEERMKRIEQGRDDTLGRKLGI